MIVAALGAPVVLTIVLACIIIIPLARYEQRRVKRKALDLKYKDNVLVDKLMNNTIWKGQTIEQLFDSLGKPLYVKHIQLKTKDKVELSYNQCGKGRFKTTIVIETRQGVEQVVGWRTGSR